MESVKEIAGLKLSETLNQQKISDLESVIQS
jgi:hypothetical protein